MTTTTITITCDQRGDHLVMVASDGDSYAVANVRKDVVISHRDQGQLAEIGMRGEILECVQLQFVISKSIGVANGERNVQPYPGGGKPRIRLTCGSESGTFCHNVCIVPARAGQELSMCPNCPSLRRTATQLGPNCSIGESRTIGNIVLHSRVHIDFEFPRLWQNRSKNGKVGRIADERTSTGPRNLG